MAIIERLTGNPPEFSGEGVVGSAVRTEDRIQAVSGSPLGVQGFSWATWPQGISLDEGHLVSPEQKMKSSFSPLLFR